MAKSLDNTLRTMNEYLKDMFDTFGGASQEYSTALQQVKAALPDNVLNQTTRQGLHYAGAEPTQPLQFARGKQSQSVLQNFSADLDKLRQEQRATGTAKVQQQVYIREEKIEKGKDYKGTSKETIKQRANERYDFNNNVNDWYEDIDKSVDLTKAEKDEIKDKYRDIRSDYDDPTFRRGLRDMVQQAKAAAAERAAKATAGAAPVPFNINPLTKL